MNISIIKNKQEKYVKKHNAAIRSYSEMSLLEKKIANVLLYNAYHNLKNQNIHVISISQLLNLLSLKTNDYQKLKQAIKNLMSTTIEWNVTKKENIVTSVKPNTKLFDSKENWKACTLLASVQIEGTIIKYEYSEILRELFYQPSFYSKISLCIQSKFRSNYSINLYENCLSYLNCGTTGWLDIETFKKIMGIKLSQYKIFRDFNRRVLKPSIQEVNMVSNIEVSHEIKKIGQVVSAIKFYITHKKNYTEKTIINTNPEIVDILITYGASKAQSILWVEKYGGEYIKEKINIIKNYLVTIKNPIAFLSKAIKENWSNSNIQQPEIHKPQQICEKQYVSNEENKIWFNTLTDERKIETLSKAILKFPMLKIHMEYQKIDILDKKFVNNNLFRLLMQILDRML